MHELSICQSLLRQVTQIAREHDDSPVRLIELQVGVLSGVEPELLRQAFPVASRGTLAEGARLLIDERPVRVHCEACGSDSDAEANDLHCRTCGNWRTRLVSGNELVLARIEIESADPVPG